MRGISVRGAEKVFDLLEGLLASSPDLVFVKDLDGRFQFANLRMVQVLGFASSHDVIGKTESELTPGDEAESAEREESRLLEDEAPVRRETLLTGHDGTSCWYSLLKSVFRDSDGKVTGLVGIGRDIGALKKALALAEASRYQNEVFRRLINALPDIVFAKDPEGKFIVANTATAELMKAEDANALIGNTDFDFYPPDLAQRYRSDEVEFMKDAQSQIIEQPVWRPDGSRGYLCSLKVPMLDSAGKVVGYIGHGRDVTETRVAEYALRQREAELAEAQLLGNTGSCSWRHGSGDISCSVGMGPLFGLPAKAATRSARFLLRYIVPGDRGKVFAAIRAAAGDTGTQNVQFRVRSDDGHLRVIQAAVRMGNSFEGELTYYGVCHDITERMAAETALHTLAYTDTLTGLANRAAITERLESKLKHASDPSLHLSLLLVDLDGFKRVNDSRGHLAGDKILVEVAKRLRRSTREHEIIGRLGGDEFAIILEHEPGPEIPAKVARRCIGAMREPFEVEGATASISASIGIVTTTDRTQTISQLLVCADRALYRAKQEGRDGYRFYGSSGEGPMPDDASEGLASELRRALKEGQIYPFFQVQVRADGSEVIGVEALARWNHPERGFVSPSEFIGIAERSSVIGDFGRRMLDCSCAQLRTWIDDGWNPGIVSVNISVAQMWHTDLARDITMTLLRHKLVPNQLVLEFTESVFIQEDHQRVRDTLDALDGLGVGLAIDDFGAGFSGLGYLNSLPFHHLKIDKSYVTGAHADEKRTALLRGIVSMGAAVGMTTTAEGVETSEDAALVRELGCEFSQGYYYGIPRPAEDFPGTEVPAASA